LGRAITVRRVYDLPMAAGSLRIGILGLLALAALGAPAGAAAGDGPAHSSVGFEPVPLSVAADAAGHVYLSNPLANDAIQQYSSAGVLLAELDSFARSSSPFLPRAIATDAAGAVYVADSTNRQISVLGPDGGLLRKWSAGGGHDLGVGADGSVYLVGGYEVQRFAADGAPLPGWGEGGGGPGQLGEAWGVDTSPSGMVYVADTYGNRIKVFTADGAPVAEWGSYGRAPGQFIYPYGIAVSPAGEVYVADTVNARVQRYSASGELIGSWGGPGKEAGRFYTPTSIATDPAGYVYVADRAEPYPLESRARIQKFTAGGQFVTQWYDVPPPPGAPRLHSTVKRRTTNRFAAFRFHSHQKEVRFACRLTGAGVAPKLRNWRRCASPKRYAHLRPGRKVFHVRAVRGGLAGRGAARSWTILAGGWR
jgi:DNA-binding beta-propeller fold protein YncE